MKKKPEPLPTLPKYPEETPEIIKEGERLYRIAKDRLVHPKDWGTFVHENGSPEYVKFWDEYNRVHKKIKEMGYTLG